MGCEGMAKGAKSPWGKAEETPVAGESPIQDRLILDLFFRDLPKITYSLISAWVLF